MFHKHEANSQEKHNAERNLNKSRLATLLKSHTCTNRPLKICSTSTEHPSLVGHFQGTVSAYQKNFKRINL